MSPAPPWTSLYWTYVGSSVGKSKSEVIAGSDCPLSDRKNPSKFPSSLANRYDAIADQLFDSLRFNVTSNALYLCVGPSNALVSSPPQLTVGIEESIFAIAYSTDAVAHSSRK